MYRAFLFCDRRCSFQMKRRGESRYEWAIIAFHYEEWYSNRKRCAGSLTGCLNRKTVLLRQDAGKEKMNSSGDFPAQDEQMKDKDQSEKRKTRKSGCISRDKNRIFRERIYGRKIAVLIAAETGISAAAGSGKMCLGLGGSCSWDVWTAGTYCKAAVNNVVALRKDLQNVDRRWL